MGVAYSSPPSLTLSSGSYIPDSLDPPVTMQDPDLCYHAMMNIADL